MCSRISCEAKAEYRPVLVIPVAGYSKPIRAVMGVGLCMACKYQTSIDDVLSDDGWEHIEGMLLGQLPVQRLDRAKVRVEFVGIKSKESLAYEAMQRKDN